MKDKQLRQLAPVQLQEWQIEQILDGIPLWVQDCSEFYWVMRLRLILFPSVDLFYFSLECSEVNVKAPWFGIQEGQKWGQIWEAKCVSGSLGEVEFKHTEMLTTKPLPTRPNWI
jgi:hypothetical protein